MEAAMMNRLSGTIKEQVLNYRELIKNGMLNEDIQVSFTKEHHVKLTYLNRSNPRKWHSKIRD